MIVVDGPEIGHFVAQKLGIVLTPPFRALGFLADDHRPLAAFVFTKSDADMELTAYAERGGITRGVIRFIANYVFNQNGCRRLTVRTKKRNRRVLKLAPRYGFKYEGIQRHFYADDDAVVFGMLRDNCRWLS